MMDQKLIKRTSKFLSLILRHNPQLIGLQLDSNGWASTEELLQKIKPKGFQLTLDELAYVVEHNDKQRFSLSSDLKKIRANQGHSIQVDLGLLPKEPPELLYHGTAEKNLPSIRTQGLIKGTRHHVHLSPDHWTAMRVGQRHGKPVVLTVDSGAMHRQGMEFYLSENGVWLTEEVPVLFIRFPRG